MVRLITRPDQPSMEAVANVPVTSGQSDVLRIQGAASSPGRGWMYDTRRPDGVAIGARLMSWSSRQLEIATARDGITSGRFEDEETMEQHEDRSTWNSSRSTSRFGFRAKGSHRESSGALSTPAKRAPTASLVLFSLFSVSFPNLFS